MVFKILAVVLVVLVAVIYFRPSQFRIERSTLISAPAEAVFGHVNDLHQWEAWSPWAKLDPNATNSFEGALSGVGAVMSWVGNKNVGVGSMTITESLASERIQFRLDFLKPFKGTNTAEFTFKPEANQTRVTWSMSGENNFIGKAISLFMNCDKMVGGQFEKGLASLKSVVETGNI